MSSNSLDITEWERNQTICEKQTVFCDDKGKVLERNIGHTYHNPVYSQGYVIWGRHFDRNPGGLLTFLGIIVILIGFVLSISTSALGYWCGIGFVISILGLFLALCGIDMASGKPDTIINMQASERNEQAWRSIHDSHQPFNSLLADAYGLHNISISRFNIDGYATGRATHDGQLYNIILLKAVHDGKTTLTAYQTGSSVPLAVKGNGKNYK